MPIVSRGYGKVPTWHECIVIKEKLNIIFVDCFISIHKGHE
jgi:hypothetical protein